VKFRTFLRTLVHELAHHLDYELYKLAETFHTEGFYARESALMHDLLNENRGQSRNILYFYSDPDFRFKDAG